MAANPYKRVRAYGSRHDVWNEGYRDGWARRPRRKTEREVFDEETRKIQLLLNVYNAAMDLHKAEDFEEMPCQHACCAPADWDAYQATRKRLYDALMTFRESVEERAGAA
jgi:hypothetical protein